MGNNRCVQFAPAATEPAPASRSAFLPATVRTEQLKVQDRLPPVGNDKPENGKRSKGSGMCSIPLRFGRADDIAFTIATEGPLLKKAHTFMAMLRGMASIMKAAAGRNFHTRQGCLAEKKYFLALCRVQ